MGVRGIHGEQLFHAIGQGVIACIHLFLFSLNIKVRASDAGAIPTLARISLPA
jgi:hypothetical protein